MVRDFIFAGRIFKREAFARWKRRAFRYQTGAAEDPMSKIMYFLKQTVKLLFNRIFYIVIALLVQLGWLFLLSWRLTEYSRYFSAAMSLLGLISVFAIANKRINPSFKLTWTLVITTIPIFGLILYLVFGQSRIASAMQKRFDVIFAGSREFRRQNQNVLEEIRQEDPSMAVQAAYIGQFAGYPVWKHTEA